MKCILKIGYYEILLPSNKGIATVIDALSRGVSCRSHYGSSVITIEEELEISFKMVSNTAKFEASEALQEKFEERFEIKKPRQAKQKQLRGSATVALLPFERKS